MRTTSLVLCSLLVLAAPTGAARAEEPDAPHELEASSRSLRGARGEIFFAPGAIGLDEGQSKKLRRRLPHLLRAPEGWRIVVEGHADAVGAPYENADLARVRAEHVARLLRRAGVPEERIVVVARGEAAPAGDNRTREGRAKNRRVVLKLEPVGDAAMMTMR